MARPQRPPPRKSRFEKREGLRSVTADGQSEAGSTVTVAEAVEKAEAAIAAAGWAERRGDAEALVADAVGVEVEQLSNGAGELPADVAAELEQRVARRAEHE